MRFSLSHPLIKYAAIGVAAILLIIITVTPLMTTIVEGWSRRDVELRSRLVFRSIEDRVTNAISVAGSSDLTSYFEHSHRRYQRCAKSTTNKEPTRPTERDWSDQDAIQGNQRCHPRSQAGPIGGNTRAALRKGRCGGR